MSAVLQKELSKDIFENRLPQVLESLNMTLKSCGGKYFAANKVKNFSMVICLILNERLNNMVHIYVL